MRSTFARTARTSTARLSTQISPFSRIWIWMLSCVLVWRRLERRRAIDLEAGLFDEDGGDDEEDQQIDDEVEHRREVDAGVFLICS